MRWAGRTLANYCIPSARWVGQQHAPVDFSSKVGVLARSCPNVHELGGLFVHLTGCLSSTESDPVHTSRQRHMVSVLASETVNPNEPHTAMISAIIFAGLFLDLETMPASSAYDIPRIGCGSASLLGFISPFLSPPPPPPAPHCTPYHTTSFITSASALYRSTATRSTAVNNILNNNGASTHSCRNPCPTPNQSEYSPSSVRMRARMPSWKWRITARASLVVRSNRASTVHERVRSTEAYALARSTKHM